MKVVVTHNAPDWDAVTSAWLLKRFLPGWNTAEIRFVPAGERIQRLDNQRLASSFKSPAQNVIEKAGKDDVIHVDTGLGPLDHHQTSDLSVCAASRTWEYVKSVHSSQFTTHGESDRGEKKAEAIDRIVKIVVEIDHFREVFWDNPTADYHEFSLIGVLEGYKIQYPGDDQKCIEFGFNCLDALLHNFENRIWAEKEITESGVVFQTRFGKGIGFEIINDTVLKLAQKMGYVLVVRKDPRKGYVRVKARPELKTQPVRQAQGKLSKLKTQNNIDLTNTYEQLKKMDPEASWYLHVSKKMLLNGTPKNPKMIPTKLSLSQIIDVLKQI